MPWGESARDVQSASVAQVVAAHHSPACSEVPTDPRGQSSGGGPRSSAAAGVAARRRSAPSSAARSGRGTGTGSVAVSPLAQLL